MYYKDIVGYMDEVDNIFENNWGFMKRGFFIDGSVEVGLVGVFFCDLFNINKLLLDNIEIKIKVDLNSNEFVLMFGEEVNDCKIKIMLSIFRVCMVWVVDSIKLEYVSIM